MEPMGRRIGDVTFKVLSWAFSWLIRALPPITLINFYFSWVICNLLMVHSFSVYLETPESMIAIAVRSYQGKLVKLVVVCPN